MSSRPSDPQPPYGTASAPDTQRLAATALAAMIALVAWGAFAAQTDITIHRLLLRGLDVTEGLERLTSYLTNLTIFAVAICFSCVATRTRLAPGRFLRHPSVVTAVVIYIVFVGIAYNALLRYLWTPTGFHALVNECLHTIVPLLCALYWLLFVPRFTLTLRDCAWWLVYPLGYLFVTLWRGSETDFYPYPFIDVGELGYERVFVNALLLLLGFVVLVAIFAAINGRRARNAR